MEERLCGSWPVGHTLSKVSERLARSLKVTAGRFVFAEWDRHRRKSTELDRGFQ